MRAWNVRTGEHEWDFHTVPNSADEFGSDTWLNESWRYSGNGNVWSMLAGDNELGYVYLPTGTVTNDYYGADRLGDNLFSESIVAVDIETGQRVWHFQAVHHGLWDYDFPAAPNLLDIVVERPVVMMTGSHSFQGYWVPSTQGLTLIQLPWIYNIQDKRWMPSQDAFIRPPDGPKRVAVWNENCIQCHALGGNPNEIDGSGLLMSRVSEMGISCEACHGPGAKHAVDPTRARMVRNPGEELCRTCHSDEQTEGRFVWKDYLPKVDHKS